uniref:Uncharacterized protein n=1 Tax=Pseudoalteromonas rubra TaxID=43658 RepID=A0A0F4QWN1_9GAMM|nr:hypothetical protein TW77_04810 [Pseudoalteromonas rubra]
MSYNFDNLAPGSCAETIKAHYFVALWLGDRAAGPGFQFSADKCPVVGRGKRLTLRSDSYDATMPKRLGAEKRKRI